MIEGSTQRLKLIDFGLSKVGKHRVVHQTVARTLCAFDPVGACAPCQRGAWHQLRPAEACALASWGAHCLRQLESVGERALCASWNRRVSTAEARAAMPMTFAAKGRCPGSCGRKHLISAA